MEFGPPQATVLRDLRLAPAAKPGLHGAGSSDVKLSVRGNRMLSDGPEGAVPSVRRIWTPIKLYAKMRGGQGKFHVQGQIPASRLLIIWLFQVTTSCSPETSVQAPHIVAS